MIYSWSLDGHDLELFVQVATAAIIFSAVLSVYLYVSARMNKDCMKATRVKVRRRPYDGGYGPSQAQARRYD